MDVFYTDSFVLPLPPTHSFPASKYARLRRRLVDEAIIPAAWLRIPERAGAEEIARAHDPDYYLRVIEGRLSEREVREIGLPWSPELVERSLRSVGATLAAARSVLASVRACDARPDGLCVAFNLAGGTHHAHRDFGSGFCVYNDFAVTALHLIGTGQVSRVAIIDLDGHQGDGNAAILSGHPDVFVFSMHGERNFPFRKHDSDLDVGLPDGTGDAAYLHALDTHLPEVFAFRPGIVLYQAGVDPLAEDRLGRLSLTHAGLRMRDRMVLDACARGGIPVSLGLGGGYAEPIDATVTANLNTWAEARAHF